jgi:succinate dehydrogenase flavin-adding protein (antitoxin of CptAB toxin-antitoxin module)
MTEDQLDKYETLLSEADSDLVAWITNDRAAPEHYDHDVMTMLKSIDYIKILK